MSRRVSDVVRHRLTSTWAAGALALLGALALPGCLDPLTCVDLGCPYLQRCDAETGECVDRVTDCNVDSSICGPDEYCSAALGRCLSLQQRCGRDQAQCPRGQECDAERGVCTPIGLCNTDGDCDPGEQCSRAGECESIPCETSLDCGLLGFICELDVCVPGCALPEAPCPEGKFCRTMGEVTGECISGCSRDKDCDFGYFCDLSLEQPTCVREASCDEDDDCRDDELCRLGACEQSPCAEDDDCASGQTCARAQCVGGGCTEDKFSPNHAVDEAAALPQGVDIANLSLCAGRADWYALELDGGEVLEVELRHDAGVDLELYLLDPSLELLRADERRQTVSTLSYQARADEGVYLLVDTAALTSTSYGLSVTRTQANACQDDNFEDNDTLHGALALTLDPNTPVSLPLALCYEDEDWFTIRDLAADAGLSATGQPTDGVIPEVTLYTPDGEVLDIPAAVGLTMLRAGAEGDYHVRVRSPRRQPAELTLALTELPPYACEGAGAQATLEDAAAIAPDALISQRLCPSQETWEIDWFALEAPDAPAVIRVKAQVDGAPALRVALVAETDDPEQPTRIVRVAETGEDGVVELGALVAPAQELSVRVSSEAPLGRLLEPPRYQIVYQYEEIQ